MKNFPDNFLWGSAASAPQTEGYSLKEGKSATTWDKWFEMDPDMFYKEQGPENTSNVYELYKEDIQRMKDLGLNSYRTSISWSRLLPDGKTLNEKAVAFYTSYFQTLKDNDVEPIINLFHFDMPWWLMELGGWETRISVEAFAAYARIAFECFGGIVKKWTTFNEPIVHVECGYLYGYHYPAEENFKKAVQVGYNTLLAHARAVEEFRKIEDAGEIGIILNISPAYARSENEKDLLAKKNYDLLNIQSFLDPAVHGKIPEDLIQLINDNDLTPETEAGDKKLLEQNTVDFIGLNYYQPARVQAPSNTDKDTRVLLPSDIYEPYDWPGKVINPYRGWEIFPEALYDVAMMIKENYNNIPWYVSENGMGVAEEERFMNSDGMIEDDYRIDFFKEHLTALHRGIEAGSNCFGYHTWTFVDCWSWLNGYKNRYGFYCMDLENNYKRSLKKSGVWYSALIQANGFEN